MSQKTELQSNNTDLQTILGKVNALPSGAALGDATAADVASGKTFSSASGIKVAGTAVEKMQGKTFVTTMKSSMAMTAQLGTSSVGALTACFGNNTSLISHGDILISRSQRVCGLVLSSGGQLMVFLFGNSDNYGSISCAKGTVFEVYR